MKIVISIVSYQVQIVENPFVIKLSWYRNVQLVNQFGLRVRSGWSIFGQCRKILPFVQVICQVG